MKQIFSTIIGITLLTGLLLIMRSFIEIYAPELIFLGTAMKGLLFATALMGLVIIIKSGSELVYARSRK